MDVVNSIVEWFNGLVGLQYAGYGPITAIGIGILTVWVSIKVLKFFFKPFAPLFQDDASLGQSNPVLAQQGIRHSQMTGSEDEHDASGLHTPRLHTPSLRERSRNRASRARDRFRKSRREEFDDMEDEAMFEDFNDMSADNDSEMMNFSDALEDAWQDDQSTQLRAEIAPLRPVTSRKNSAVQNVPRPTASAAPSASTPVIRIENFGETSRSSGAANRMALRFGMGVTETLGRIPNLAIESSTSGPCAKTSAPAFTVEASIELQSDGVHVSLAVRDTSDGSHLMAREMTCSPAQMQDFEKEVSLEIAAAVIANQRLSGGQPVMPAQTTQPVTGPASGQAERSEKTYPTARRPLLARLRRTDQPTQ